MEKKPSSIVLTPISQNACACGSLINKKYGTYLTCLSGRGQTASAYVYSNSFNGEATILNDDDAY